MARRYLKYFTTAADGLITPVAQVYTYGRDAKGRRARLTRDNAIGFVADQRSGRLSMCTYGYHLFKPSAERLAHVNEPGQEWYWVVPVEPATPLTIGPNFVDGYNQVIVRSYRIVGKPKPWEIRRAQKDQVRSHKKRPGRPAFGVPTP